MSELERVHERAAVITDIHGNLPALEAALARIDELGIDALTVLWWRSRRIPPEGRTRSAT